MRFVVDENLPDILVDWLSNRGHDVVHVRDWLRDGLADPLIWARAMDEERAIVSKDRDFPTRREQEGGPQIVRLLVGNRNNRALLSDVEYGWPAAMAELDAGSAIVTIVRAPA